MHAHLRTVLIILYTYGRILNKDLFVFHCRNHFWCLAFCLPHQWLIMIYLQSPAIRSNTILWPVSTDQFTTFKYLSLCFITI